MAWGLCNPTAPIKGKRKQTKLLISFKAKIPNSIPQNGETTNIDVNVKKSNAEHLKSISRIIDSPNLLWFFF